MLARAHLPLSHNCTLCGAVHSILNGHATLTLPGHVPPKTTRFELEDAARQYVIPGMEPQLTDWIDDGAPLREGFYHFRFPNGTEADRNWWFDPPSGTWWYDKTGTVRISHNAIGAWRGLDKQYQ
jgi:hypothetical protein